MRTRFEPRFADCHQCRHFDHRRIKRQCLGCTFGQFFEEKLEEMDLEKGFSSFKGKSDDE